MLSDRSFIAAFFLEALVRLFGGCLALEFAEERAPSTPARALADSSRGEHAAGFLSSALSSRSRFPILVWTSILLHLVNHDIIVTAIVICVSVRSSDLSNKNIVLMVQEVAIMIR